MPATRHKPIPLRSVTDLQRTGYQLHGSCERDGCRKIWRLSLGKVSAALGANFPYADVRYRLTCPVCGADGCGAFVNYG